MRQEAHGPHQEAEEEEEGGSRQREARCGQDPPQEHGTLIMNEDGIISFQFTRQP